jgi:hypothetical protein
MGTPSTHTGHPHGDGSPVRASLQVYSHGELSVLTRRTLSTHTGTRMRTRCALVDLEVELEVVVAIDIRVERRLVRTTLPSATHPHTSHIGRARARARGQQGCS